MFKTNRPVSADSFYNRENELATLKRASSSLIKNDPKWFALIGPRKIGKTSLLLELKRQLTPKQVRFVLLDTYESSVQSFEVFKLYGMRILDSLFAKEIGASLEVAARQPTQYRALLQSSKTFLSLPDQLRTQILELSERKLDLDFVRDILDLPEQLAETLNTHFWIMWDEFQQVARIKQANKKVDLLPVVRSRWQHHVRVAYTISGSERGMMIELTTAEHSPFFQHFALMDIGPIPKASARALLHDSSADLGRTIPSPIADTMVEIIGGHPFYLQLFGDILTSKYYPYDDSSLKAALSDLLFAKTGSLSLYFENSYRALVGRSSQLERIMQTISEGPKTLSEIAVATGASTGTTAHNLQRLRDAIVKNEHNQYEITDHVFKLWLSAGLPGGTAVPMTLVGTEAEIEVAHQLARLGFELVYQSRASRGAFDLLAVRGEIQLGIQVKRTTLPVRFKKTEWQRMQSDAKRLGWQWIIAVLDSEAPHEVFLLNPQKAKIGKEVSLAQNAQIDNLLDWLL